MTKPVKFPSFEEYVVKGILTSNKLGIDEIHNLKSLKSIFFVSEQYPEIEKIIKEGQIELLRNFPEKQTNTGEYLEVMLFTDQRHNQYIVTVYDSLVLEQDPQVIEIYTL